MVTFSLLISLGTVLGLSWSVYHVKERQALQTIDCALGILLGGLAGSRIAYVAVHGFYYREHLLEILQIWLGGFSGVGTLGGVLAAGLLIAWLSHQQFSVLADYFFPALMLVTVAAWLSCWLEGIAFGPQVAGSIWGLPARDEWGLYTARFPTQLIGVILTLLLFGLIEARRTTQKWHPGWAAAWGFLGVSTILVGLSFLRADPSRYWNGLRLDTWGSLCLVIVSIIFLLLQWRSKRV
jgi:prolipoprotein diacylglyceryltransferase